MNISLKPYYSFVCALAHISSHAIWLCASKNLFLTKIEFCWTLEDMRINIIVRSDEVFYDQIHEIYCYSIRCSVEITQTKHLVSIVMRSDNITKPYSRPTLHSVWFDICVWFSERNGIDWAASFFFQFLEIRYKENEKNVIVQSVHVLDSPVFRLSIQLRCSIVALLSFWFWQIGKGLHCCWLTFGVFECIQTECNWGSRRKFHRIRPHWSITWS